MPFHLTHHSPTHDLAQAVVSSAAAKREADAFYRDVVAGLSAKAKSIPSKYLYDRRGSGLFEEICHLDEYYLTRIETSIMQRHAHEMAGAIGRRACLVELGSGSSNKTRMLLKETHELARYVPFDISADFLCAAAEQLQREFPHISVRPHVGDFTADLRLPELEGSRERLVFYFPGSTVGNLMPHQAIELFGQMSASAGARCGLLIGIDLQKDARTIEAAYNDARGVTAAFSKNLLARINRELAGNFDLDAFEHVAKYNTIACRVDIGLASLRAQTVSLAGQRFAFERGEVIHTETSYKYRIGEFASLASVAGFHLLKTWTDPREYFAVLYLETDA